MVRRIGIFAVTLALIGMMPASASGLVPDHQPQGPPTAAGPKPANATFGAGPASKTKIDGRPYFSYDASAGGSIEDHIAIVNLAHKRQTLSVYAVDATSASNGDFTYAPQSAARTGAGAWLAVGTPGASGKVTVKARSTTILPVHLTVPNNAPPGDHAAAVIVSLTGLVNGKSGERVRLQQRVATRVIVRVSGPLRPQLRIANLKATYAASLGVFSRGTATVSYDIVNTGNVLLGGAQQVTVHGLFGTTSRAEATPIVPLLLPGASYPVTVRIRNVAPEVRMTAKVEFAPAGLKGQVDPGLRLITATTHFWAVPWILIAIIVFLLLVLAEVIRRRRPRRKAGDTVDTATPQGVPV
jgi:hypothetical protein